MRNILVIEDDALIIEYYHELLTEHGYHVCKAMNGQEAMEHLSNSKFDVVILDMSLPFMHGRSILLHIKKISRNLPIIISSGKIGMQDDPEIQLSEQVKKFLLKPVAPEKLLQTVQQVILENIHKNLEGRNFAGCSLQNFIEAGSNGAVYKATKQGSVVAVKVLTAKLENKNLGPPQEAKVLYRLKHPNIIDVKDMGLEDFMPFIVMEYFEGESLYKIVQRQGLITLEEAIPIVLQIAEGMILSHRCNLIHRDLKPSNILYSRRQNLAKIIDFGIAREVNQTQNNLEVTGSPYYMSPEQCQGLSLDATTDVYSLGVTFFHIITGVVPYNRCNTLQTMLAHIQSPLQWPSKIGQHIPEEIRCIIKRMMAKDKSDRYSSMKEFIDDLHKFMKSFSLNKTSRCIPKTKL